MAGWFSGRPWREANGGAAYFFAEAVLTGLAADLPAGAAAAFLAASSSRYSGMAVSAPPATASTGRFQRLANSSMSAVCLKALCGTAPFGRSISTPSLHEGLIYQAEYNGNIHCLDAETGKILWTYATNSRIWSSTVVADGKVYCGNEDGELVILKAGREMKLIGKPEFYTPIYCTPVVANNTLYVSTMTHLFAIGK